MISPARWAAFEALRRADSSLGPGKDLASALSETRGLAADPRDRALATEIALGTERWRAALDARLAAAADRPISSIDVPALLSLRLALFQLRHLTRTPAHAVVDDAVQIVKRAGAKSAAGFVNAVLRTILRDGIDAGQEQRPTGNDRADWLQYLSTTLSHPAWLAQRWLDRYGTEAAEAWAAFNNSAAPLAVRVNTRRLDVDDARRRLGETGVETTLCRYAPDALLVTAGNPIGTPLYRDGAIALMDEASQLVGVLASRMLRGAVLDACAAPGGKTLVMACELPQGSRLIAADRRERRVALLARSIARFGVDVPIVQHDLSSGAPFGSLDGILVDAPCSGLGTIRRDPDIRWRRSEGDLGPLAASQARLLSRAAAALKPGGRLVYATCSSEPEENELVVDGFLDGHPDFARARIERAEFARFVDGRGDFRTLPHRDGLESFYAALLVRTL